MANSKTKKSLPIAKKSSTQLSYKNIFKISKDSFALMFNNRVVFSKILIIYAFIYFLLVLGFSAPGSISSVSAGQKAYGGYLTKIESSLSSFGLLLNSSSSSSNPSSGVYGVFLFILLSLVLIWTIKKIDSKTPFKVKEAYYSSMGPFIPFVLILTLIAIELIPLSLAFVLYNYVIVGGIAVGFIEHTIWAIIMVLLALISFYFISSSIFALIITAYQNTTPMLALKTAKKLVKGMRLTVSLKIIFLFVLIFLLVAILTTVFILIAAPIAPWILQVMLLLSILFAYSYIIILYRDLVQNGSKKSQR